MARADSTAEKIAPQGLTANNLEAFWMPFTANRQFKKAPRLLVARRGHVLLDRRRPEDPRRHRRPLVRQCRPRPRPRSPTRSPSRSGRSTTRRAFQMGHPNVFELAARLVTYMPQGLDHVFFTNSGSESVETGAEDRARLPARPRRGRALPPDRPRARLSRRQFRRHLGRRHRQQPQACSARCSPASTTSATPTTSRGTPSPRGQPEHGGVELADDLERLVALHDASTIAAVIVEPVAGSTGVLMPPKGYLERLRADLRQARHPADLRRGDHRLRAARRAVRRRLFRRDAGHRAHRQGRHQRRRADGRGVRQEGDPRRLHERPGAPHRVLPRLHLFGQPGVVCRRPRHPRHLRGGGPPHPRRGDRQILGGRAPQPQGAAARHRHPQLRPGRRDRARADRRTRRPSAPSPRSSRPSRRGS